jgi:hypothetical protein
MGWHPYERRLAGGHPIPGEVSEWDGFSPMDRYAGHGDDGRGEARPEAGGGADWGASATAGA